MKDEKVKESAKRADKTAAASEGVAEQPKARRKKAEAGSPNRASERRAAASAVTKRRRNGLTRLPLALPSPFGWAIVPASLHQTGGRSMGPTVKEVSER